jgi:uncharacterized membrane protein
MLHALSAFTIDPYLRDWFDVIIRWTHVIAAIGWIGSSFYFVLLDQSLRAPREQQDIDDGVGGELWEVHGGGFYHVKKYRVAPPELPDHLAWFKWEAYATWLTGFSLLVGLFWLNAGATMIDPSVATLTDWQAVSISAGLLILAWGLYDLGCRLIRNERTLAVTIAVGIAVAAWGCSELYAPRAAWLQVGAMLGTIMAGSVFFNIIPAHWELIRAKEAGRDPDPAPGIEAKRRSVHNNYFTLPVLFTMLAGHFGFLTGHDHAWVLLLCFMALGAFIRHFYNLRHRGKSHWWMWAAAAAVVVFLFFALKPEDGEGGGSASKGHAAKPASAAAIAAGADVFDTAGCKGCHTLEDAGATGQVGPNLDGAQPSEDLVRDRVTNGKGGMPSFRGQLSDEEIDDVAAYVSSAAGTKDG